MSSYRHPDLAKHVPQGSPVPPPASRKQVLQVTGPLVHKHEGHKYERRPWHLEGFPCLRRPKPRGAKGRLGISSALVRVSV